MRLTSTFILTLLLNTSIFAQFSYKEYPQSAHQFVLDYSITSNGDNLVSGYTSSHTANPLYGKAGFIAKTDINLNLVWYKDLVAFGNTFCSAVTETPDGNLVAFGSANNNAQVLKMDMNGDTIWTKTIIVPSAVTFMYTNPQDPANIINTKDGGFATVSTGINFNHSNDSRQIFVSKLDANGDTLWTYFNRIDIDTHTSYGFDIIEDVLGNLYVTGQIDGGNASCSFDNCILKFNTSGELLYKKTYFPGTGYELLFGYNGNLIMTGYSFSHITNGPSGPWLIEIEPVSGDTVKVKRHFTKDQCDKYSKLIQYGDNSNNFLALGFGFSPVGTYVTKLDNNLDLKANHVPIPLLNDVAYINNSTFVFAGSRYESGQRDFFLMSVDSLLDFEQYSSVTYFTSTQNFEVYPNPSHNGVFNISIDNNTQLQQENIHLYSIQGKQLPLPRFSNTTKESIIDLSSLPDGQYILSITTDTYHNTQIISKQ